jgi:hypothetical protein
MRLEKRIKALEAKMFSDPVILCFADGSTRTLSGQRYFLLDLFSGACGGDPSPEERAQLDLIRKSVFAREPGGGRMVEMMQSLMDGSAEENRDAVDRQQTSLLCPPQGRLGKLNPKVRDAREGCKENRP